MKGQKRFSRITVRILLFIALAIAVAVIVVDLYISRSLHKVDFAAIAAALAVITAAVASYSAHRVIEIQQDATRPHPYPAVDLGRYGLFQLCISNYGASPAYDVEVIWDEPLLNMDSKPVLGEGAPHANIPVLLPGEKILYPIGVHKRVMSQGTLTYSGTIRFKDVTERAYEDRFCLSLEKYRGNYLYDNEFVKMSYDLQKLPNLLEAILEELRKNR